MNIFLDTSALVAWFNRDDKYHSDAQRVLDDIRKGRLSFTRFVLSDYVVDETLTFFESVVKDPELAVRVGEALLGSGYVYLERVDSEVFSDSWERFKRSSGFSFTDCTSMTLMDSRGIRAVFTFDAHFTRAGYSQIP